MNRPARHPKDTLTPRIEALVADAAESFAATMHLQDGTRSAQIVAWSRVFEWVLTAAFRDEVAA